MTRKLTILAALFALTALPAGADAKWKIKGAGWGHGIGMSQWGTQGYAKKGKSYKWILRHYYTGTRLGKAQGKRIRVLLSAGIGAVTFTDATKACGKKLSKSKHYFAVPSGSGVALANVRGKVKKRCGSKLVATGGNSLVIGRSAYRGKLVARPASGGINVINDVDLESYVKGVVPNESPSSWEQQALRAQAVAARSYALATGVGGNGYDAYDDTRSQVYGGKATEQGSTNQAVRKTANQVVISRGKVAATFFFSTSGGKTENIENVWGSDPQKHLKGVKDPYDKLSPYHRWTVMYSRRSLSADLGDWVKGKLKKVKILRTGYSPRVISAKVVGTGGKTKVSGSDIQIRLGLRDTWFKFCKKRKCWGATNLNKSGKKKSGNKDGGSGTGDGGEEGGGGNGPGGGEDTGGILLPGVQAAGGGGPPA